MADTIVRFESKTNGGNGFVFKEYKADTMLDAVEQAVRLFGQKRTWSRLMKAGMAADFSWEISARKYAELFVRLGAR